MAVGTARVFTSCWRHTGERPVRWTCQCRLGVGAKGLQGWHWVSLGGRGRQGEPGQGEGELRGPSIHPLGAPQSTSFWTGPFIARYWRPCPQSSQLPQEGGGVL